MLERRNGLRNEQGKEGVGQDVDEKQLRVRWYRSPLISGARAGREKKLLDELALEHKWPVSNPQG